MASNNLVPVQLTPDINNADKVAYINENFRVIGEAFNPIRMSDGSVDRVIVGRYVHTNGVIYYGMFGRDEDGTLRAFWGVNPVTGTFGLYISTEGIDVIDELTS